MIQLVSNCQLLNYPSLFFGSHSHDPNLANTDNLLCLGGLPGHLQTYDLSLGTALFEQPYNGHVRNVRGRNCTAAHMARLHVAASQSLRFTGDSDACASSPCANFGVCLLADEPPAQYRCDCAFTGFAGKTCGKVGESRYIFYVINKLTHIIYGVVFFY